MERALSSSRALPEQAQPAREHQRNQNRRHVAAERFPDGVGGVADISELLAPQRLGQHPAGKGCNRQTAQRQHQITGNEVGEIEDVAIGQPHF